MSEPTEKPLLPCPFCGKAAEHDARHWNGRDVTKPEHTGHAIYCSDMACIGCPPFSEVFDTFEAAAEEWNTRAPSAQLAAVEAQAAAMRETLTRSRETFLWLLDRHGAQSAKLRAEEIYATLESTNAGAELLDRLSKAEALAIQMTAEREHNAMEALAMRAERDRLRAENESLRKSLSPTTTEKPNQQ